LFTIEYNKNKDIYGTDKHLSKKGNQILARYLFEEIKSNYGQKISN